MESRVHEQFAEQRRTARAEVAKQTWERAAVAQIETAIQDVKQRLATLEVLADEECRKSPRNPNHPTFPMFGKALLTRRDNLRSTLASLTRQLSSAANRQGKDAS